MTKLVLLISAAALLAACGGGGHVGSTAATETQSSQPPPASTMPSDGFISQVWAIIQGTSETSGPTAVDSAAGSQPENTEPAPLG